MRTFTFIGLVPDSVDGCAAAARITQYGALGAVDVGLGGDDAILGDRSVGIRISADTAESDFDRFFPPTTKRPVVMLTSGRGDALADLVRRLRGHASSVLLEVVSAADAAVAVEVGVDGVIAKGHESGGWVGEETTFVLLQRLLATCGLPVYAHGGIGVHTVAACYAMGAAGAVLDVQLGVTKDSPWPMPVREALSRMDGSETICLGRGIGPMFRGYARPGLRVVDDLRRIAESLIDEGLPSREAQQRWQSEVIARAGWKPDAQTWWPIGQDGAFAQPLATRFRTLAGVFDGLRDAITDHVRAARGCQPLAPGSALALAHRTRYPIVQGPMTRVSDTPAFAAAVQTNGALPMIALALLRGDPMRSLLTETKRRIGDGPWGVGILGFVPQDVRDEQLAAICECKPPFALIAGGRPDQAARLEQAGISTYLHVPSPGLLDLFLEIGARRFVFEGRECGGHVGPRCSFALWETMVATLLEKLSPEELARCHVLFAGGIHDARSAAGVGALGSTLAARGASIGVLLGTAYLFTDEAVTAGAITEGFQREAMACSDTVLLESGPGHATRCVPTPFVAAFEAERRRMQVAGETPESVKATLERLNLGRLRLAAKGLVRRAETGNPDRSTIQPASDDEQRRDGLYMIGQVAALRHVSCRMADLHEDVSSGASRQLAALPDPEVTKPRTARQRASDVAIVGIGCLLPKASDVQTYWDNILEKRDAIVEVPSHRWEWQQYFDPDPAARDKVYSRWGGFLDPVHFDPLRYGLPPSSLPSIEPMQLLALEVVRATLADAGLGDGAQYPRERTSVILGAGGGVADLGQQYAVRAGLPMLLERLPESAAERLPEWTEDSFAGLLLNVTAGRAANRFDFGGVNYTVDAACASSLAAIYLAVRELESGDSDMVIAGGVDTVQNPFGYLCFSKTHALSPRGRCRPFDQDADGIVISEGLAMVALKRLDDAERDGDRIYAVIKGVAGSSDGRAKGLTAPRPEGQALALRRAYEKAAVSPASVGLMEAHGTGTVAGDRAEVATLIRVFREAGAARQRCAIGSVKSMIGHTKCAAGVAGLIKVALALHHRTLPPTMNVDKPNAGAGFPESPFFVNTETRPWLRGQQDHPRRGAVSAFGFGGTNFHAVLEEHAESAVCSGSLRWPYELLLFRGTTRSQVLADIDVVASALRRGAQPPLRDLALTLWRLAESRDGRILAVVTSSLEDLAGKLATARSLLQSDTVSQHLPDGVCWAAEPLATVGRTAFVFPGQGSQFPGMLRELALYFDDVRASFEDADRWLADEATPLSAFVFPPSRFGPDDEKAAEARLTRTDIAQPALGAANLGIIRVLRSLGVVPDLVAGHSYGEYVALHAAGAFDEQTLLLLSRARGQAIRDAAGSAAGVMAAVAAAPDHVREILAGRDGVWIANMNGPRQTVLSGTADAMPGALAACRQRGVASSMVPVACAFHSPLVAAARDRLATHLAGVSFQAPRIPVFSNTLGDRYPEEAAEMAALLTDHLVRPVNFWGEIERMYAAGARIFVEAGPKSVLSGLIDQILEGLPHLTVAPGAVRPSGLAHFLGVVGLLAAHGVRVNLERLFSGRNARQLDLGKLVEDTQVMPPPAGAWLVDGGRAQPLHQSARVQSKPQSKPEAVSMPAATSGKTRMPLAMPERIPSVAIAGALDKRSEIGPHDDRVFLEFQELMQEFLDTQSEIMKAWLGRSARPAATQSVGDAPSHSLPNVPAVPTDAGEIVPALNSREELSQELVRIASERTGYPEDILSLDVQIEADLGIDSIKRVEIVGAFVHAHLGTAVADRGLTERMHQAATLGTVIDVAIEALSGPQPAAALTEPPAGSAANLARFVLRTVEIPAPGPAGQPSFGGVALITGDRDGVAGSVATRLRASGLNAVCVHNADGPAGDTSEYASDLTDPAEVERLLSAIRAAHGPIGAIIHLLPLSPPSEDTTSDIQRWRSDLRRYVRSLFLLVRNAGTDLLSTGRRGRACVLAALRGSEAPAASDDVPIEPAEPTMGGVSGFIKALSEEWADVRCRVVTLDPRDAGIWPDQIVRECGIDGPIEVGYRNGSRLGIRAVSAPRVPDEPTAAIDSASVVVVTGGGRGITAEVVCELARRTRATFCLIGRSPMPAPDDPELAAFDTDAALRKALIDRARRNNSAVTPARLAAESARVLAGREIRSTLVAIAEAGGHAHYYQADARDAKAIAAVVQEISQRHGRIQGVIHGAGIIEDRLVIEKQPDSFDRVIATKVEAAFALYEALDFDGLGFVVFMSSVAGVFGNRGQADYAAANQILSRLAVRLNARHRARVLSVDWGPWAKAGMVSPEVARRFASLGVQLIDPALGREALVAEILGGSSDAEIILGDGPWSARPLAAAASAPHLPLLASATVRVDGDRVVATRVFDPMHDWYLSDHCLDGRPVLPAAVALELALEAATLLARGATVVGADDVRVLKGITFENGAVELCITAHRRDAIVEVKISEQGIARPSYCATIVLGASRAAVDVKPLALERAEAFPHTIDDAYATWLFHGHLMRGISSVDGISRSGIVATLTASKPSALIAGVNGDEWLLDPVVVDSAFQLAILWTRANLNMTPLPARLRRLRLYEPINGAPVSCTLRARPAAGGHLLDTDITLFGADGVLLAELQGMEFGCSGALNRLGGTLVGQDAGR